MSTRAKLTVQGNENVMGQSRLAGVLQQPSDTGRCIRRLLKQPIQRLADDFKGLLAPDQAGDQLFQFGHGVLTIC
jgi:hypothetical protein